QAALKHIKSAVDFNSAAALNHLQVHSTGEFPRANRQVPGIGSFAEATEAAAIVSKIPTTIDRVLENDGNSFIFQVVGRTLPTEQEWKAEGSAFSQQFLQQRRNTAWMNFINDLKLATPISINTDLVSQNSGPAQM
ncbi:MAG: hypothetical protein JO071_02830, partial [Deltaproteobacteria bacterium]|nr:hypothetical protein [Deltaproteobacteria bacterium]